MKNNRNFLKCSIWRNIIGMIAVNLLKAQRNCVDIDDMIFGDEMFPLRDR